MKSFLVLPLLFVFAFGVRADEKKTQAKTYHVPYRLTGTNHILIRAKINGKGPYNFILDTGAPALFVSTAVGRKLNVTPDKKGWGTFERFEIEGGVVLTKFPGRIEDPFQLEGMNGLGLAGVELHGIIGYTILARYRLEFDLSKSKLAWQPLDYNPPPPRGLQGPTAPSGMEAIGAILKVLGAFLGKTPQPEIVLRGFLGITLEEAGDTVVIKAVLPESPAAVAGLKTGDRIVRLQGKSVRSIDQVLRQAAKIEGDVQLGIRRDNEQLSFRITPGKGL